MSVDESAPDEAEIRRWFLDSSDVEPGTFEFALVLGGTVSAGAYTAGVIDYLIEALDCFSEARRAGTTPQHKVVLRLITGTSGGGVNAAIAARALAYRYPHVTRDTPIKSAQTRNPFYDIWVNTLRLGPFLETNDIVDDLRSLLNGAPIDKGAANIVKFSDGSAQGREWVAAPLRVILTTTNLRGIPYKLDFGDHRGQSYVDHADYIRFAVLYPEQALGTPRPDELVLPFDAESVPQQASWNDFSLAARATAAFPIGFPARLLKRPTNHYRYRVVASPSEKGALDSYFVLTPDWDAMRSRPGGAVPDEWQFLAVDGGATDNEPIELARTALCGLLNRNPRDPDKANRAVWLIDPFAGEADLGPDRHTSFVNELGSINTMFTQQTRYDTADLKMASDPDIYSRFMLTPTRLDRHGKMLLGANAIASSGLGAFIGFACPAFMRFDYLLGRQNCQTFLREEFVLDEANPLFEAWTAEERAKFARPADHGMLPIIPLVSSAAAEQTLDDWPKGKLDPESFRPTIEARYRAICKVGLPNHLGKTPVAWLLGQFTQRQVSDFIIGAINTYLAKANLN
jgi:predicted acylesterase/phospholipase RssA